MSVNKVILLGRLGKDPEIRNTNNGKTVANFSIATSEKYKDKEGQAQERTEWHRIAVFGKLADICGQYLHKGRQAYIEGKLQTRSWENDQGVKQYTTEVVAANVQFVGGQPQEIARDAVSFDDDFAADKENIPF